MQFLSQSAVLTVLAYKVDIIAECGARSYRPRVLRARQGRSISVCFLAQQEPADSAVPAGDSVLFSGGCCKWLQLGFDINIPPCVRPTGRAGQLARCDCFPGSASRLGETVGY